MDSLCGDINFVLGRYGINISPGFGKIQKHINNDKVEKD